MYLYVLATVFISCNGNSDIAATKNQHLFRENLLKTEDDFKNLSQSKGIAVAFYAFADENAVIKRENDTLIKGKENIKAYYSNPKFKNASVSWKPDFVEVSADGSLAYTYGKFVWTSKDSLGNQKEFKGRFHTVWKRQKDGSWKYVWD